MSRIEDGVTGSVTVRQEAATDRAAVRRINELAFEGAAEADLVEALHREGLVLASLVADVNGDTVGHIMFSRMWVDTAGGAVDAACLAPVAVLPLQQRRGIGTALITRGLDKMRRLGERVVIVVGHPAYYPRFGFEPANAYGLTSPFPPEAFMVMELVPEELRRMVGPVRYPAPFGI
jgi:putative acetyltransferase